MTVQEAMRKVDEANAAVAIGTLEFLDTHEDDMLAAMDRYERRNNMEGFREDLHQLRALVQGAKKASDRFLQAQIDQASV